MPCGNARFSWPGPVKTQQGFRRHLGSALVVCQFSLIAVLVWMAWPAAMAGQVPPAAWAGKVIGALLALWAVSINRLGNFNIHPEPRAGGTLVQRGPYRWVRHPMYTAVMVCGLACAWASGVGFAWLIVSGLAGVLAFKANIEEHWMREVHPGYSAYCRRTSRFIPWVY